MYSCTCHWCRPTPPDSPSTTLVFSGSEICDQIQKFISLFDQIVDAIIFGSETIAHLFFLIVIHIFQVLFDTSIHDDPFGFIIIEKFQQSFVSVVIELI